MGSGLTLTIPQKKYGALKKGNEHGERKQAAVLHIDGNKGWIHQAASHQKQSMNGSGLSINVINKKRPINSCIAKFWLTYPSTCLHYPI